MMQLITDMPANTVGFRATGEVTSQDYQRVVIPAIEALLTHVDRINFLLLLDTSVREFTLGAWLDDLKVGLQKFARWRRMAIVSDSEKVRKFTNAFSKIAPGEARGFTKAELQAAKNWVAEPGS